MHQRDTAIPVIPLLVLAFALFASSWVKCIKACRDSERRLGPSIRFDWAAVAESRTLRTCIWRKETLFSSWSSTMQQARACVVLLVALAAVAVSGRPQRQLQQVTMFYDTPAAAGSTSVGLNGNAQVRPDGTFHAAGGGSVASSNAIANPILRAVTGGAFDNRPKAASSAYTQIPLALQWTRYPTLSYGLAEAKGDVLSTSNGGWGNVEFGYNPLNNNLGTSISTGTANSANVGGSERVGELGPNLGASGVEFAGYSNDLTNLADSRTDQSAQAIAYPFNILRPANTLTCTQALLYAVTLTQYDLGAPVTPLSRENPPSIIPFCLTLFNFGTLDDFSNFVNNRGQNVTLPLPGTGNTTSVAAGSGNEPGSTFVDPPGFAQPLPGSNATGTAKRSAANPQQMPKSEPKTLSGVINKAVEGAPDQIKKLAQTQLFKSLLGRITDSSFAMFYDGVNQLVAKQAAKLTQNMAGPMADFNKAMSNFTNQVASGTTNTVIKGAVAGVETAEPLLAATAAINKALQPAAKASKAAAEKLAADSQKKVQEAVAQLPPGEEKKVVKQALQQAQVGKRRLSRKRLLRHL